MCIHFPTTQKTKNECGIIVFLNSEADELKSIHMLQKLIMNEFFVQAYFQEYKQYHT